MSEDVKKIAIANGEEVARYGGEAAPQANGEPAGGAAGASTASTSAAPAAATPAQPPFDAAALQAELAQTKDKLLRAQAECVNISRRLNDEKSQALRMAAAAFARDLLTVLDNFERTLDSMKDRPADDPLAQGIRLTYDSMVKVLRDHGVESIESVGKPFDPAVHEALLQQESADIPAGHVLTEWSKGYKIFDRTLRPARVAVAKSPEGAAAPPAAPPGESSES